MTSARLDEKKVAPPLPPLTRLARNYQARTIDSGWVRGANYIWVLVALAAGLALRVNRLAVQSLWNDEGTSVALGRLSLPAIISGAAHDIHPPLYYLLLHYWIDLAGDGEFGVRFLSVLAGVLLIAATFRLARMFFDHEVAIIAAFLSSLSAFQLYYSQETRMYILVALWSALSVWAMARLLLGSRGGLLFPWLAYVSTTVAALYTHYFAFTLVLFENLAFLTWLIWRWQEGGREHLAPFSNLKTATLWVGTQVLLVVAFLPWLAFAGNQLATWPAISEPLSATDLVSRVLSAFVLQVDSPVGAELYIVAAYAVFFIAGLLPSLDLFRQSFWGITLAAIWVLVPLAAMYVISLQRPDYDPKFLLLATPGFFIIAARGLSILNPGFFLRDRARRYMQERSGVVRSLMTWQFLFTFGIVAGGALIAVRDVYYDPRLQRDDYRGIAHYIDGVATADDAVLVDAPGQIDVVRYYYRGPADVQTLPIGRPVQTEPTRAALEELTAQHKNLYAVFWATEQADPDNLVETFLDTRAFKASEEWRGNVRFAQYALPPAFHSRGPQPSGAKFGDEIGLVQFEIGAGLNDSSDGGLTHSVRAGTILPLVLQWMDLQPPAANYKVFIHLLDANGKLVGQRDMEPVSGHRPTTTWRVGEKIQDLAGLLIPPGTPAGKYSIELGLYRPEDGKRLRLSSGDDHLILDSIIIQE